MTEVFPLEFVVHGTPPSANKSGKKDRYQTRVRGEARKSLPRRRYVPTVEPVIVRMVFCFDKSAGLDTDNFIKWILDAMIRTVYHEDSQVIDVVASARRFAAAGQIRGAPVDRADAGVGRAGLRLPLRGPGGREGTAVTEHEERDVLNEVAREYEREGYRVAVEPDPRNLPQWLAELRPDLVAQRDGESVLVEVVTRRSAQAGERARRLAEAVRRQDGWRFDFVLRLRQRAGEKPMSVPEVEARLAAAEALADGDPAAGLLLAWTAAEWALRQALGEAGFPPDDAFTPHRIVKEAYSRTELTERMYEALRRLADRRDAIVHGRRVGRVGPAAARKAAALVRDLVDHRADDLSSPSQTMTAA